MRRNWCPGDGYLSRACARGRVELHEAILRGLVSRPMMVERLGSSCGE